LAATARREGAALADQPQFLKLWAGQTISLFGSEVSQLALPLTAALTLQASAFQMGLLGAIQYSPWILVALFAGAWVDRQRRVPIMMTADLCRAFALGTIPVAAALGVLSIGHLYAAAFVAGVFTVFFEVAYQSFVPFLVGRERLAGSNSKLEFSFSFAQVTGPGLAGALVQAITAPIAIAVDAVSFLASAAWLRGIRAHEPLPQSDGRTGLWHDIAEGLRIVARDPLIRTITSSVGIANLGMNIQYAVYVLFLVREVAIGPVAIGLLFGIGGAAALMGATSATRLSRLLGCGRTIVVGWVAAAAGFLITPLVPVSPAALPLLALGRLLYGFGIPVCNIHQTTLRQAITPDELQGRVSAGFRLVVRGVLPIGLLVGGALGEVVGLRATLLIGAVGPLVALLLILVSSIPNLQKSPVGES
jgi:MFS family permease